MRIYAEYGEPRQEREMELYGMQQGNRIVPFRLELPRSLALAALVSGEWPQEVQVRPEGDFAPELRNPNREVGNAVLALVLAACSLVLLGILRRFCLHRRMWLALLYAGSGLAPLTLLNLWNATWVG